jgi:hypothetical protein
MYKHVVTAVLVLGIALGLAPTAQAAKRPPLPSVALPSDPLFPPAYEQQAPSNAVRVPTARDLIAIRYGKTYCKDGPHNFDAAGVKTGGKAFSATLDTPRFCHTRNQVSGIGISTDHRIYGTYNFWMRFDHESIEKGFYNWRRHGNFSGYFVRAKFYFLFCFEPTHNLCTKTYTVYLRNYVHADGTSSTFKTILGL